MKKMTTAIITLLLIVGLQSAAYSRDYQRPAHNKGKWSQRNNVQLVDGPLMVEFEKGRKHKHKRRHCFPAQMKVWINGSLTKVEVTVCKKRGNWIVSPVHINMGTRGAQFGWKRGRKHGPSYDDKYRSRHRSQRHVTVNLPLPWMVR